MGDRYAGDTRAGYTLDKLPSRYRHGVLSGTLQLTVGAIFLLIG
jgi:hypothetical protein